MEEKEDSKYANYTFHEVKNASFPTLKSKETQDLFSKWGMLNHMQILQFKFEQEFKKYKENDFLWRFFNDPNVRSSFAVCNSKGGFSSLYGKVEKVIFKELNKNVIRMDFFNRLYDSGIVRKNETITRCFDIFLDDGMTVSNKLFELFLCPDSDNWDLYSEEERDEFIFHIMKRICIGGAMNQYEDKFTHYFETTKGIYKDLVRYYCCDFHSLLRIVLEKVL